MSETSYLFVCSNGNKYRSSGQNIYEAWDKLNMQNPSMDGVVSITDLEWEIRNLKKKIEAGS